MKRFALMLLVVSMGAAVVCGADMSKMMADVAQRNANGLAIIKYVVTDEVGGSQTLGGTGICIDASGILMTAAIDARLKPEMLKDFQVIIPGPEGKTLKAQLQGIDPETNLSFVQALDPYAWTPIQFAARADLAIGQPVVSMGLLQEDMNYAPYYGTGYVSSKLRVPGFLAYVTGGRLTNAGSPVFAEDGRAIGIVGTQLFLQYQMTTGRGAMSVGLKGQQESMFFTPSEEFAHVIANIPTPGQPRRLPWIGVISFIAISKDTADTLNVKTPAVQIDNVVDNSPASKAGLQNNDLIVELNGQPLERFGTPELVSQNLQRQLSRIAIGQKVTLGILRNNKPSSVTVTTEPMPTRPDEAPRYISQAMGFAAREKIMLDRYLDKSSTGKVDGLIVLAVGQGSPAEGGGLKEADLITTANDQPIKTVAALKQILESAAPGKAINLTVRRGDQSQAVSIMPPAVKK